MKPFTLGKTQKERVMQAGKIYLMDGDGHILDGSYDDMTKAEAAAKRQAKKLEDDVYIYAPVKKATTSDPAVVLEEVKA